MNYIIDTYGPHMWITITLAFPQITRRTTIKVVKPPPIQFLVEGDDPDTLYKAPKPDEVQLTFTKITYGEVSVYCTYFAPTDTLYVRGVSDDQ